MIIWIFFLIIPVNGVTVYVPVTTSDFGSRDIFNSPDILHHCTNLNSFGFPTNEITEMKFEIKACGDTAVYVHDNVRIYNIYIGGYWNTRSFIRKRRADLTNNDEAEVSAVLLNCSDFKQFWFSWDQGFIKFGSGNQTQQNVLVSWLDSTPFVPTEASISTGFSHTGNWFISVDYQENANPVRFNNCYLDNRKALLDVVFTRICSRAQCSALCGAISGCVGFNYQKIDESCEVLAPTSGVIKSPQILQESGWMYFSKCTKNNICFGCFF